ncbi:hypothetical protein VP424E501_P0280 [Vibrio phage 424E50-1]|nr:hypothetical protein VP424E501_P0280 [Vibrio phage 424E50-1]
MVKFVTQVHCFNCFTMVSLPSPSNLGICKNKYLELTKDE